MGHLLGFDPRGIETLLIVRPVIQSWPNPFEGLKQFAKENGVSDANIIDAIKQQSAELATRD